MSYDIVSFILYYLSIRITWLSRKTWPFYVLNMPLFLVWMTYCEFGVLWVSQSLLRRARFWCRKSERHFQKRVTFENRPGTVKRKTDKHHVTIFKQTNYRRLYFKFFASFCIKTKSKTYICTWNLHWESMHESYSIWYHSKDEFMLFKTLCRFIRNPFLLRVPMQQKQQPPQIPTVSQFGLAVRS